MPSQVRYIQRKDSSFDHYVQELLDEEGYGHERTYYGIAEQERCDTVVRKLRTAGRNHLGVGMKVFSRPCTGCADGGDDCRFHVLFTAYDMDEARAYIERKRAYAEKKQA